jgi:hypothetical protein
MDVLNRRCSVTEHKLDIGTCYCPNSNFGHPYCKQSPQWYHGDGHNGKMYTGDRHPYPDPDEFDDDEFEAEPRKCGNCGAMARMLKDNEPRRRDGFLY